MADLTHQEIDKFHSRQCANCIHDAEFRNNEGSGCPILLETIFSMETPEEWELHICDKFEPEEK